MSPCASASEVPWAGQFARMRTRLARIELVARKLRMDEALWFKTQTAPEQYQQDALRKLLNAIEERG